MPVMTMSPMQHKAVTWLINGETGLSSIVLCAAVLGIEPDDNYHPGDPADFNRCLKFLRDVPEARAHIGNAAKLSEAWKRIIERWDDVEKCFLDEVGIDWHKDRRAKASKTYDLMKSIYGDADK